MQRDLPLVSIIITSYNREGLVSKAIESALSQDYPNLEIIISDNCSTDGSDAVIRKYINDPRVKYNRNSENIGMMNNFRKATYLLSKGDYITYISSDDYLIYNSFISDAMLLVSKHDHISMIFGKTRREEEDRNRTVELPEKPFFLQEVWKGRDVFFTSSEASYILYFSAGIFKRDAMIKVGALQNELVYSDLEATFKIMLLDENVGFVNQVCYLQYIHSGGASFLGDAPSYNRHFEFFDNMSVYAADILPSETARLKEWRDNFILSGLHWGLNSLREEGKNEECKIVMAEAKEKYPDVFSLYAKSYRKQVFVRRIKTFLPAGLVRSVKEIKGKIDFGSAKIK